MLCRGLHPPQAPLLFRTPGAPSPGCRRHKKPFHIRPFSHHNRSITPFPPIFHPNYRALTKPLWNLITPCLSTSSRFEYTIEDWLRLVILTVAGITSNPGSPSANKLPLDPRRARPSAQSFNFEQNLSRWVGEAEQAVDGVTRHTSVEVLAGFVIWAHVALASYAPVEIGVVQVHHLLA